MEESSIPVSVSSSDDEMKIAIESMSTVHSVNVFCEVFEQRTDTPLSTSFGRRWIVTFTSQKGNLPSLLVNTGSSNPSTIATGGSLSGSSPIIMIKTLFDGGVPQHVVTPIIECGTSCYVQISAYNGYFWSIPTISPLNINQSLQPPTAPLDVKVKVLSDTEMAVSWKPPSQLENDKVTEYTVQWDTDSLFDFKSSVIASKDENKDYLFVIQNLNPLSTYFVRVMAHNTEGYGEVAMAKLEDILNPVYEITLLDSINAIPNKLDLFHIEMTILNTTISFSEISVFSPAKEVEDLLNSNDIMKMVSVSREEHSSIFDSSGFDTAPFKMVYRITFVALISEDVSLTIGENLDTITASVQSKQGVVQSDINISLSQVRPTGPKNVQLVVVSKTELGLTWDTPSFNGGLPITKYLVEWDKISAFDSSKVTPSNPYSNVLDGPLVSSQVVTTTKYQISGLKIGVRYYSGYLHSIM